MYMDYCKFRGTLEELRVCIADVEARMSHDKRYAVSEEEINEFKEMVLEMWDFLCRCDLVTECDTGLNRKVLEEIAEDMRFENEYAEDDDPYL